MPLIILKPITDSAPAIEIIKILKICPIPSLKLKLELILTMLLLITLFLSQ